MYYVDEPYKDKYKYLPTCRLVDPNNLDMISDSNRFYSKIQTFMEHDLKKKTRRETEIITIHRISPNRSTLQGLSLTCAVGVFI